MSDAPAAVLQAIDICKSFANANAEAAAGDDRLAILRGASLTLDAGDAAAIMGPSGSGKSTFLSILGTLDRPTSGTLLINGDNPFEMNDAGLAHFRNRRIGFVFQDHHLLPQCSVLENVLVPTLAFADNPDRRERARELLERVGLSHRLTHRPAELSGGERQRTAIARALINNPSVVLADEPTGNLDEKTAAQVSDLLLSLPDRDGVVLVTVTHSRRLAERFAQRLVLADGRLEREPAR